MALEFTGNSLALSSQGMASVAGQLSVGLAEIAAVFSVETHGAGFLSDRRPQILFERHIFSRLTGGIYDNSDPSVSAPTPGGYGPGGANQYMRLGEAIALDRQAALQSASWGLGQVMGENYQAAGFADVETMVAAMVDSEDAQLAAMGTLIEQNNLAKSLACHDWQSFARGYNGPNYAINRYDVELNGYYQKYLVSATQTSDSCCSDLSPIQRFRPPRRRRHLGERYLGCNWKVPNLRWDSRYRPTRRANDLCVGSYASHSSYDLDRNLLVARLFHHCQSDFIERHVALQKPRMVG